MKNIIVFYTRTQHSKFVAEGIKKATGFDILEIKDLKDRYGFKNYMQAGYDSGNKILTQTEPKKFDFSLYKKVVFVYPYWSGEITPAPFTFLKENNLKEKEVYAVIVEAMFGAEKTLKEFEKRVKEGDGIFKKGFIIKSFLKSKLSLVDKGVFIGTEIEAEILDTKLSLEEILEFAIQSEEDACEFYKTLEDKIEILESKNTLKKIEEDEKLHKEQLAKEYKKRFKKDFIGSSQREKVLDLSGLDDNIFKGSQAIQVIDMAIKGEKLSIKLYKKLLNDYKEESELAEFVKNLIKFEEEHITKLKTIYSEIEKKYFLDAV